MKRGRVINAVSGLLLVAASVSMGGCLEWIEIDGPVQTPETGDTPPLLPHHEFEATFPNVPPRASAPGPLVPQTPGLRVPDGYWTRVRIDQADLLLPYTWGMLQPAGYVANGELRGTMLRLQSGGVGGQSAKGEPALRAVIRIATPPKTKQDALVGLSFGADALVDSTVSVRLSKGTLWTVVPEWLSIDTMDEHVMTGTLEGQARAGKRAKRSRTFRAAFVALRAGSSQARSPASNLDKP